jgi:hypothetical protein
MADGSDTSNNNNNNNNNTNTGRATQGEACRTQRYVGFRLVESSTNFIYEIIVSLE